MLHTPIVPLRLRFALDSGSFSREIAAEIPLSGGRMTSGVVRVGDTVRRPVGPRSPFVHALLKLLDERGVTVAPRLVGVDAAGREVLSYLEGWVPPNLEGRCWRDDQIIAAAGVVRQVHDATEGSTLADAFEVVCHGDLSPCNFVFVDGTPRYVIDFDAASPGTRRSDLAYMAWMWLIGDEDGSEVPPLTSRLRQMRILLDAYELVDRHGFAEAIQERQRAVRDSMSSRGSPTWWVQSEMAFVAANAALIDAAATEAQS